MTSELAKPNKRVISNSEVMTYLKCQRMHFYGFGLGLEPVRTPARFLRGNLGHTALEIFYRAQLEGESQEDAKALATETLALSLLEFQDDEEATKIIWDLEALLERYWDFYKDEPWEVVSVEAELRIPETSRWDFGFRTDLVVRDLRTGYYHVVDHKFVYNFWQRNDFDLNVQLPKYVYGLRKSGINVHFPIVNQIRWRKTKLPPPPENTFTRTPLRPTDREIDRLMWEHREVADTISDRLEGGLESYEKSALRVMNPMTCRSCVFKSLCKTDLLGGDRRHAVAANFKPSTYRYSTDDETA